MAAGPEGRDLAQDRPLPVRSVERTLASRYSAYVDEGQRQLVGHLEHQMAKERSGLAKVGRRVDAIMSQAVDRRAGLTPAAWP